MPPTWRDGPMTIVDSATRLARGEMEDVARIYDDCHRELYGYVASLTRDMPAAEDLVHEAFARLVRERAMGRMPDEPRAWLYKVCTNLVFSRSRRRAIASRWLQLVGRTERSDTDEPAEDAVMRRERHADVMRALDTLPRDHRVALLLAADGFTGRRSRGSSAEAKARHGRSCGAPGSR